MKKMLFKSSKFFAAVMLSLVVGATSYAQTVYDIISNSPNHTSLTAAIDQAGLNGTLSDATLEFTVFAPDNNAIDDLVAELGITVNDFLNDPNLDDYLLYHVLNTEVGSGAINNGDIVTPLNNANTLKLTVTATSDVFVNQAQVNAADLTGTNGVVHSLNAVVLANETVADVAIDNSFGTLVAAVVEARLLPALTDPFASLTVFAPSDAAFNAALAELGISAGDLLASPDLENILLYHVLGVEVASGAINNGDIVNPLNPANSIKMTVTGAGDVYANQALVELADVAADNGTVHAIDAVILSNETVVDAAIDNNFTILTDAVIEARLLPALTNPFADLTVFAPTDAAFNDLLTDLGITAGDLLASPNLEDILLYHVVGAEVLSGDLVNGPVTTLNGSDVVIDLTSGVFVNDAEVITADVDVDNGVVHAIDKVLDPATASIEDLNFETVSIYPNPTVNFVNIESVSNGSYSIVDMNGSVVLSGEISANPVNVSNLQEGSYFININSDNNVYRSRFVKM